MYLPKHIPMFHPNALSCTQLPSDQPEAELLYDADVYNDRVPPIPPPIFHRRQPHPDADLLYDDSVYQVYFPPKTVTYVFRPPPPHPDADLLYDESVYCAYFPLYRCEQARSACELSLANIPSTKGHIVTGQSDKKDKRTELAENNDKKKLGVSEHRVFGTMYRDSNSVTQERHMQLHLKALIHSFNNVWYGLYWTKHSLMLYTFPEAATSDTDTDYHETFAHELVTSVVLLQGLLDGLMILSEGAAPDVNFHSRNFCDHKMRDIRKQMMMLKSVGDETRPELYADFWGIANFWKHYFPYTLLPTCRGSRSIHDVYVKLGDNIVSGPLMHDLFVPMYNLTRKLLDRMSIFLALNEKIEDSLTWFDSHDII